jgi:hypothetical protein
MYGLVEQVALIDALVYADRIACRTAHIERVTSSIQRWQRLGLMEPAVDPPTTASQLVSMTSNFCYWWFVGGEEHEEERAASVLTETWVRALDLRSRPRKAWLQAQPS